MKRHLEGHLSPQHPAAAARLGPRCQPFQSLLCLSTFRVRKPHRLERDLVPHPFQVGAELGGAQAVTYRMLGQGVDH